MMTTFDRQGSNQEPEPRMAEVLRWYVIRVKTGRDEMAARGFARLQLEVFQPWMRVDRPGSGTRRFHQKPLFHGYLFVRFDATERLETVRYTPGVAYVVASGQTPLPVDDQVIDELRARLDADGLFRLARPRFFPRQLVTVQEGPFAGLVGRVEQEWDDGRRVAILLDALQQARVLVPANALASINP